MTLGQISKPDLDEPRIYQIRVKGHLGQQWKDRFNGLSITQENDGTTLLKGTVVDQSALYGILKKIRDLGMPLLSLNSTDLNQSPKADADKTKNG